MCRRAAEMFCDCWNLPDAGMCLFFLAGKLRFRAARNFPPNGAAPPTNSPASRFPRRIAPIESRTADEYLSKRLADAAHPVQVLALGPLTNLAEGFHTRSARSPRGSSTGDHGRRDQCSGKFGRWRSVQDKQHGMPNGICIIDPAAAKIVFASGAPIRLVPLDATQRVPIDMAMFEQFQSHASTPLARFVAQVLATNRESIRQGFYFAWDPLAAAILANPLVVTFRPMAIEVSDKPGELGRTVEVKKNRPNMQVAIDADALRFREVFMTALGVR